MPTRRNFLTAALSAIASLPCMGWLGRKPKVPNFTNGTARFEFVLLQPPPFHEIVGRWNNTPWYGFAPGTVQLREWEWTRDGYGVIRGSVGFRRADSDVAFLYTCDGEIVHTVSNQQLYGEADFNDFDFGEPV